MNIKNKVRLIKTAKYMALAGAGVGFLTAGGDLINYMTAAFIVCNGANMYALQKIYQGKENLQKNKKGLEAVIQ